LTNKLWKLEEAPMDHMGPDLVSYPPMVVDVSAAAAAYDDDEVSLACAQTVPSCKLG
jgi:hypothetical protein